MSSRCPSSPSTKALVARARVSQVASSTRPSLRVFRHKVPRLLLGAQFLSEIGDWAARGVLQIIVFERTHSPTWTALVVAASLSPWLGPGQLLAAAVERLDKRRVMIASDLLRATVFASLLVRMPIGVLISLLFVAGLATPVFESNRSALLRRFTPTEAYPSALSVSNVIIQVALVIGYLSGSWTVTIAGTGVALTANVISFVGSAVLLMGLPNADTLVTKHASLLRESFLMLVRDTVLRWSLLMFCLAALSSMAVEAVVAPYVLHHLGARPGWVGVSLASVAVGTLIATTAVPFGSGPRRQLRRGGVTTLVASTAAVLLFVADLDVPWVLIAFATAGAILGSVIPCNVVLGTRIPMAVQGTAISIVQGSVMGAQALGALTGGLLSQAYGERTACIAVVAAGATGALLLLVRPPRPAAFRLEIRTTAVQEVVTSID